jgi:hypothetical protein
LGAIGNGERNNEGASRDRLGTPDLIRDDGQGN